MGHPILKTPRELEAMRPAGRIVAQALKLVENMVAPGMTTRAIDEAVEALIRREGARPAFKGYPSHTPGVPPFPASICASVNEEVVHGIPDDRPLREGDILSVDIGAEFDGFYGDAARTYPVGAISRKAQKLLETTELCLRNGLAAMHAGDILRKVCLAVQETAEGAGFSVVKDFVGHGIGRAMHEPPQVPNYVAGWGEKLTGRRDWLDVRLDPGTVLAVEPMLNAGKSDVRVLSNGWTVVTKDRSLSAHFEHSAALTNDGLVILTEC